MTVPAFETYCLYLAVKQHFSSSSYDFFKYQGKVTATEQRFEKRNDKYYFKKLGNAYSRDELIPFLVANILEGRTWVGDLLSDDARSTYLRFQKYQQSFSYKFADELTSIFSSVYSPRDLFVCVSADYPYILKALLADTVSIQTFVILNQFIAFFDKFDKFLGEDDPIWSKHRTLARKLEPFIVYDKASAKRILKEVMEAAV